MHCTACWSLDLPLSNKLRQRTISTTVFGNKLCLTFTVYDIVQMIRLNKYYNWYYRRGALGKEVLHKHMQIV